jgi:hypothetical protein
MASKNDAASADNPPESLAPASTVAPRGVVAQRCPGLHALAFEALPFSALHANGDDERSKQQRPADAPQEESRRARIARRRNTSPLQEKCRERHFFLEPLKS